MPHLAESASEEEKELKQPDEAYVKEAFSAPMAIVVQGASGNGTVNREMSLD